MRHNRWLLSMVVLIAATIAQRVEAAPIAYTFSGTLSGSINGVNFFTAPFQMSLLTTTEGQTNPAPNVIRSPENVLSFTIAGVAGTFTAPFAAFRHSFGPNSSVGLSPASGNDLLSITDPSFASYDLASSFGPVTQAPPDFINTGEAYSTSAGDLILQPEPPGSVTFQADLNPVPAPGALGLMASALGGLFLLRRRKA